MKKFYFLMLFISFSFLGFGQIISQYVETNSGTTPKGIEIWNNTSGTLDFTANNLVIKKGTNGGAPTDDFTLSSTTLAAGDVIVIGTDDMEATTTGNGAVFHLKPFTFNGDDALEVWYGTTKTDVFGMPNSDPGSGWSGNGVQTWNQTIELSSGITTGSLTGWTDPSTRFEITCTDNCLTGFGIAPSSGSSPTITLSTSSLTGFSYEVGSGPSAEQSFTVEGSILTNDISIAASTNYEISTGTGGSFSATSPITLTQSGGNVASTPIYVRLKAGLALGDYNGESITATSTGATDKTVTCNGTVDPLPSPTITLSLSSLTGFNYIVGNGPSAEQSFTVEGSILTTDISIAASTNYEISTGTGGSFSATNPIVLTQSGGDVSETTIYVRLKAGLAVGAYNGENITASSTDATDKLVVCSGTVTLPTGTFVEITSLSDLSDGEYVIVNNSDAFAMNNTNAASYFEHTSVIPIANKLVNPDATIIWKIESHVDGGMTIFNEESAKYVSYTGSSNASYAVDAVSSGEERWTITYVSDEFFVTNVSNSSRILSYNSGAPRFACYDNAGQQQFHLYKKITPSVWEITAASSDWDTGSNWVDGNVPSVASDVTIPSSSSNFPVITGTTAECNDLTLQNGAELTIAVDGNLTVNGFYSNGAGTLTVKSTASGDGSLIVEGGVGGAVVVERYIGGHGGIDDAGWHLFGSPVSSSFNVATSDFAPGATDDLYYWDELNYIWKNYKAAPFSFTGGEGYLFAYESNSTKHFDAYINNQSFPKTGLTNTGGTADDGWHLLGNPYPSAVKWNDGNWTLNNMVATAQVYNEAGGNYLPVAANGYIQSTQGFFVQVSAGFTGSLTIPLASREHNDVAWYKSTDSEENALELKISGGSNSFYDITKVSFNDAANNEFNAEFDSHKLYGRPSAPQLYTIQGEETMSINTLQPQEEELIVPMEFFTRTDGEFTIEVQSNTVNTVGNIYLEDKVNNQMINLSTQSAYTFNASTTDDASRFLLHFNGVTDVEELEEAQGPMVYALENYVYISSLENMDAQVMIYSTNGQLVGQDRMNNEQLKRIAVKASPGIYLVNIQSEDAVYTEKVYIK